MTLVYYLYDTDLDTRLWCRCSEDVPAYELRIWVRVEAGRFLIRPNRGAEYDQPVWLSVCVCLCVCVSVCLSVRAYIPGTAGPIGTKCCARIPCGDGSILLRRRCATLCTSGVMDDVTFGRNGRDARKGWQHSASLINYVRDGGAESDVYECLFLLWPQWPGHIPPDIDIAKMHIRNEMKFLYVKAFKC